MKASFKTLTLCMVLLMPLPSLAECPQTMPKEVEQKLMPVILALKDAAFKGDMWDKPYENAFSTLMAAKDEASKQARVALMDYYVGEAYGEELVCAVALDGQKMITTLTLYGECDIAPSSSPTPRRHSLPIRNYALEMLKKGHVKEQCTYN